MFRALHSIAELLFPERPTHRLVRSLNASVLIAQFHPTRHGDITALARYADPAITALVHECKYHRNRAATTLLAALLRSYLEHQQGPHVLIPIPLSGRRRLSRGYNQVTQVVAHANRGLPHQLATNILSRTRHTKPQTKLSRNQRLDNMRDAFAVTGALPTDQPIIIIDDVTTTGATLEAARAALAPHTDQPITLLALAH